MHWTERALSRALFRAGSSIAARMAMIAITTRSSISVKHLLSVLITGVLSLFSLLFHLHLQRAFDEPRIVTFLHNFTDGCSRINLRNNQPGDRGKLPGIALQPESQFQQLDGNLFVAV